MCEKIQKLSFQSPPIHGLEWSPVRKTEIKLCSATGLNTWSTFILIYINDLPNVFFTSETFLFAYNTSIIGLQCSDSEIMKDVVQLLE